ncbi:harmonin-binding protein USHBP1 [Paroedura picta]|uniref:harmonin-binding protein USHBP1 n=1 Tax=Paroedura picta TaxID=143630 RepID=UPI0040576E3A
MGEVQEAGMDKGNQEPAGETFMEKTSDEEEILRYEQDITELLLTIASLHGKIEHLQHQKAREDEDFSDLGSDYTASLPRCPWRSPNLALALPPPVSREEGHADLFLDVHKAMTSLENAVLSCRSRIPSTEVELEGCPQVAEVCQSLGQGLQTFQGDNKELLPQLHSQEEASVTGLPPEEISKYKREMALYEQRNAALRVALEGKDEALRRSETTLCAYQEERDKLQRKVKELQDAVGRFENRVDRLASLDQEGGLWGLQDPVAVAQNLLHCFQRSSSTHPMFSLFSHQGPMETHTKEMDAQVQQLHGFVEKLKCLNQLLSAVLQECKSDSEHLSMLLNRQESNTTALHLAAQYSERCAEAYEVLWSLTEAQEPPGKKSAKDGDVPVTAPGDLGWVCHEMKMAVINEAVRSWRRGDASNEERSGCADFKQSSQAPSALKVDRKEVLQEYIRRLRAEQASLKLPASRAPPRADSVAARINTAIGAKVAEVQRALCDVPPMEVASPKMEKSHLVQELQTSREALADLNIQQHLMGKEKQGLELRTYTLKAHEAACLLIIRILQGDCKKSEGQQSGPSGSSSSSSSSSSSDEDLRDYIPMRTSKGTHFCSVPDAGRRQPAAEPGAQTMELCQTLARNRELKSQIQSLLRELEEELGDCRVQEMQLTELTRDFFKAHSAMVHAYRNARRKQGAQMHQLETQIGLMSRRQAAHLESLMHTLQKLESQAEGRPPPGRLSACA